MKYVINAPTSYPKPHKEGSVAPSRIEDRLMVSNYAISGDL